MLTRKIVCECGKEILFESNLDAMQKAIEAHVETHRVVKRDCSKTEAANDGESELEVLRIKNKLMDQALKESS
jgi:hypothetical protein